MSKFLLTVCAFGLLLSSSAFAEDKSPEQHREFAKKVLGSTELQWKQVFVKDGRTYRPPLLVLYRGATQASCGGKALSARGPFYCPADEKVYLDTSFFDQIATRFRGCDGGNKACQFSQAYVIARLVGRTSPNDRV
jgi:predicted metalloprotease